VLYYVDMIREVYNTVRNNNIILNSIPYRHMIVIGDACTYICLKLYDNMLNMSINVILICILFPH